MLPTVLLALTPLLAFGLSLNAPPLEVSDPLGILGPEPIVRADLGAAAIAVDVGDMGLFLQASLPGPGFAKLIEAEVDLPLAADVEDEGWGASIPVPMPEPADAAVPAGLAVLGSIAYAALRWRWIGPWFLLPLYSRLTRSDLMENEVRRRLHDLIQTDPGLSLQDLCQRSGAGWGTTVYHLQRLEQAGVLASRKQGHHRRFYIVGEVDRRDVDALGMLRNETPQKIAQYLVERPGSNQKEVCEALGISPSLAHKHLRRLESQQLITTRREWREVRYTPDPKLAGIVARAIPTTPVDGSATAAVA